MLDDVDAAEDWLDSWAAGVSAEAERAAMLSRRVAALSGDATSRDGAIRVTVGASGQLAHLDLDDRVCRLSGVELAQQIMSVMRTAQARLARRVADEVQATVGADTETGRAVTQSYESRFPAPVEDDASGVPAVTDDGAFVRFPVELVRQHAGAVEQVSEMVETARRAVGEVSMDSQAYGQLCQFLPALLAPVFYLAAEAMSGSVDALQETAMNLRAAAADTSATDVRSAGLIRAAGAAEQPRMHLPL